MDEDRKSIAEGNPGTTIAPGERWRARALDLVQRQVPGRRWLGFAAAIEDRHLAVFARSSLKRRDQRQGTAAGTQDVASRLAGGDLSPVGGARGTGGIRERAAVAPVRPHAADRRVGLPAAEAKGPVAEVEWRAGAPPPPAGGIADAGANTGVDRRLSAATLHGLARTLDPYLQGWLSRLLDLRIPAVRIHTDQAADATARRFNADAVSFGQDIMFRTGRFALDSASGLGLLGHELTHVAQTQADGTATSPDARVFAREEFAAIDNERRVLQHASGKPATTARTAPVPLVPPSRAATRAPTPRAASVDRAVAPSADDSAPSPAPELTTQQLGALKEAIYRDLIDRIRTDFERGA